MTYQDTEGNDKSDSISSDIHSNDIVLTAVPLHHQRGIDIEDDDDTYPEPNNASNYRDAMPSATVKSSTINLSNTILGAGMLAMPSAIAATGLVFGAFLIVFSACCSGFGLYLLSRCAATLHSRDASFYRVAQRTYPGAATVIDLAIAIKCFGVGVSYLIIIGDLMPQVMDPLLGGGSFAWLNDRRLWITLAMVLVVAPLSFLKRLDSLRHTSLAALMAVVYLFLLVVGSYWSPESIPPNTDLPPRPNPHSLPWFKFSTDFFTKLPIFVFAFTCHQNIFTVYNELVDNSQRYVNQVIRYSMMAGLFIYEFIGLSGYLSFGNRVLPNIILMYKPSILVTGGQAALVILQIFSYPLQCHPCRASLDKVIPYSIAHNSTENEHEDILPVLLPSDEPASYLAIDSNNDIDTSDSEHEEEEEDEDEKKEIIAQQQASLPGPRPGTSSEHRFRLLTIAILIASYILAITVNKLDLVLSLVGATGSTTISFILPGLFYWRITGLQDDSATTVTLSRKERLLRWMAGGLAVYGICVLCICVSFTLKRAIYN